MLELTVITTCRSATTPDPTHQQAVISLASYLLELAHESMEHSMDLYELLEDYDNIFNESVNVGFINETQMFV